MREAERCTGVTNAVVGAADGAAVLAERAPPLKGWSRGCSRIRLYGFYLRAIAGTEVGV